MSRTTVWVFILLALFIPASARAQHDGVPRIRAVGSPAALLLELGRDRSVTFRHVAERIARGNTIVHVVWRQTGGQLRGVTQLVTYAGGYRFLRVTLEGHASRSAAASMLGHELQHVAELAAAPWAVDDLGVAALYESIGQRSCAKGTCFDTQAAQHVGVQIFRELTDGSITSADE